MRCWRVEVEGVWFCVGGRIGVFGLVDGVFVCEARGVEGGRGRAMVHADCIKTFTFLSKANFPLVFFSTNLS